jgi:transketolase
MQAAEQLGDGVRVVSMPSAEVFAEQDDAYKEAVLPAAARKRLVIEAGHADYWYKFAGLDGDVIGINRFGESAPGGVLMKEYGFTVDNVVERAKALLA